MKHIIPTGISQRNLADLITEEHENVVLVVVRLPTKGPSESQTNNICRNKFKNGLSRSMEFIKMKRQQAVQNFLLCTQFEVQPLKTCG